jgi:uncharacterized membrane protein
LQIPFVLGHDPAGSKEVSVDVTAPADWKVVSGAGRLRLPAEESTTLQVEVQAPEGSSNSKPVQILVTAQQDGKSVGTLRLIVMVKKSALPQ